MARRWADNTPLPEPVTIRFADIYLRYKSWVEINANYHNISPFWMEWSAVQPARMCVALRIRLAGLLTRLTIRLTINASKVSKGFSTGSRVDRQVDRYVCVCLCICLRFNTSTSSPAIVWYYNWQTVFREEGFQLNAPFYCEEMTWTVTLLCSFRTIRKVMATFEVNDHYIL